MLKPHDKRTTLLRSSVWTLRLSKIFSKDGDLWAEYGRALAIEKDLALADLALNNALKYGGFGNKSRANIEYDLACVAARSGDKKKAWSWLEKSMADGFRDLKHIREEWKSVSGH